MTPPVDGDAAPLQSGPAGAFVFHIVRRLLLFALLVVVSLLAPGAARAAAPVLNLTIGTSTNPDAAVITLKDSAGNAVTVLDPGTYSVVVHDNSTLHNAHLTAPGVDRSTSVAGTGTATWTVTFRAGAGHYQCDMHPTTMLGDFRVRAFAALPVATGLANPAAFTFAPDGRIFYGERLTGNIRVIDPSTGADTLFFTVPNFTSTGEQGLLGLALHPDYPTVPALYAFVTRALPSGTENQIVRIRDSGGVGTGLTTIFHAPAGSSHNGGRIMFGPDKRLYAVIGENGFSSNAQDLGTVLGKVVRMTPTGAVPSGNPLPGNYAIAYGIRNSFGFTFDPQTGRLWETENGPECNDELNRIERFRLTNYGWGPNETCTTPPTAPRNTNQDGPNPVLPLRWYTPPIAPTGAAFCTTCALGPDSPGALFFGAFRSRDIRRVVLDSQRLSPVSQRVVYTHPGPILSVERGPDGRLYFSSSSGIFRLALS
jgi:glucose/arabinose dehydrogenase